MAITALFFGPIVLPLLECDSCDHTFCSLLTLPSCTYITYLRFAHVLLLPIVAALSYLG